MLNLLNSIGSTPNNKTSANYTPAPTPTYDNYPVIVAGQSNAVGWLNIGVPETPQTGAGQPDEPDARILQLSRTGTYPTTDPSVETLISAADPLKHWDSGSVGFPMNFSKGLLADIPATSKVIIVPTAKGATGFGNAQWTEDGLLFTDMIARANKAISLMTGTIAPPIFLWHQGEADSSMSIADYSNHLFTLIARARNEITGASQMPVIVGDFTQGGGVVAPSPTSMRNVFHNITSNVPYSAFAPSDNLPGCLH